MTDEKLNNPKQNTVNAGLPTTRKERRDTRVKPAENPPKKTVWVQMRLIPIWLRIILVLAMLAGAVVLGAMVGYGYIGDGVPSDVLKKETWTHILDIVKGKQA